MTTIIRVFTAFLWIGLVLGVLAGFGAGYQMASANPAMGSYMPVLMGFLGLLTSVLVLGAGFTLVGIYENTLAIQKAMKDGASLSMAANPGVRS